MYQAKMKLNQEEQDILAGKQGKTMAKMMPQRKTHLTALKI